MSKIVTDTAANILAIFAGQTITLDQLNEQISFEYAIAKKRPGITSYFKVQDIIEAAGVDHRYTGPNYTGTCLFTFPAVAA